MSEVRVTRTVSLFTYRASLTNAGPSFSSAIATATSLSTSTTIVDGSLSFGPAGPTSTVPSTDTFSFRHDRTVPFNWANIRWAVAAQNANQAPVVSAGLDLAVTLPAAATLAGSVSDDGLPAPPSLTLGWTQVSGPGTTTFAAPGSATTTATFSQAGIYVLRLTANDGAASSSDEVTVTVSPQNQPPSVSAGPDLSVVLPNAASLAGIATDDGRPAPPSLSVLWTQRSGPGTTSFSAPTSPATSATFSAPGSYVLRLTASDGAASAFDEVTVNVSAANLRPVANAGPDQTAPVGAVVTLNGSGSSDGNGDPLTYAWSFVSVPTGSAAAISNPGAVNPTFTIDTPGAYTLQLLVNDGQLSSLPDTVVVSTTNSAPVANAGADQAALVSQTVTLDGTGSSDADGDPLTFAWSFVSRPAGSAAALSGPTTVHPTFVVDTPGTYTVRLLVSDGTATSAADTVVVTTLNSRPVANAGPDRSVFVGQTVGLDGSGSTDIDGDPLTYAWSITSAPAGSSAAISSSTAVAPTFVADRPGTYVVQLIVRDATLSSAPDTITITTQNSAPVANAGSDQTAVAGGLVLLDGTGSFDADGQSLLFNWALTVRPAGSTAVLVNPASAGPSFVVDRPGTYVVQLIVNDGFLNSAPDTVTISTSNSMPTANAGLDQLGVPVGQPVTLNGSLSSDPDGHVLTYLWSLASRPAGSTATLAGASSVTPTFSPDRPGDYVAQLIVNDGFVDSAPDTVLIRANAGPVANAGPDQSVSTGATVTLDGTGSSDPDGQPLAYAWALTSVPAGSTATLLGAGTATPSFVADRAGAYVVELTVTDSAGATASDSVVITATGPTPVISVVATDPDATEAGPATGSFTVTRTGDLVDSLLVHYATTGSATSGTDYVPLTGSVTILSGQTSATIVVTPVDDASVEGAETVVVTLSSAPDYIVGAPAAATVTVTDNDPPLVTVQATDATAAESGSDTGTFTVTRTGPTTAPLSVGFSLGGTAAPGDYTVASTTSVVIPAGQSAATVVVTPADDGEVEAAETVTLTLVDDPSYDLGAATDATITIADNDVRPVVTLVATDPAASEPGADHGAFTLTRSGPTTAPLAVIVTVAGSATPGADYTGIGLSIEIPAGQASANVDVAPIDDPDVEGSETVTLSLVDGAAYDLGSPATASVTIADDERVTVTIAVSDGQASEAGPDAGRFTVTRTGPTGLSLVVGYATTGTATNGTDYSLLSGTVTIPAGFSSATITVSPIDDGQDEGAESVVVTLSAAASYDVGVPGLASLQIADDDGNVVTVTASDATATEAGPTSGTFTVARTGDSTAALTVLLARGGTAATADYSGTGSGATFTAIIPAGQLSVDVVITPTADNLVEGDETIVVTVQPSLTYTVGTPADATVTIVDDPAVVSVVSTDATAQEAGANPGVITVSRSGGNVAAALTVSVSIGGTATNSSDYGFIGGSVTIPANQTAAALTITPVADNLVEPAESVTVTVQPATTYTVGAESTAAVTIEDDPAVVNVTATDALASETGPDTGTFTFSRSGGNTAAALVVLFSHSGTASEGTDYANIGGAVATVTIPANQGSATVTITPIPDALVEGSETAIVTLNTSTAYTVGASSTATVTIQDATVPTVTVVASANGSEVGPTPGAFTFTRTGSTTADLLVSYSVTGTAVAPADFGGALVGGTVTILAGQTTVTVPVPVVVDDVNEGLETVIVTVTDAAAYNPGVPSTATMTVTDDPPTVTVASIDANAAELGSDPAVFTVSRGGATTADRDVAVVVTGTATFGADYAISSPAIQTISGTTGNFTVRIPAGQASVTVTVTPSLDATGEGPETVIFTGEGSVATATIADEPLANIVATDAVAAEGGSDPATFTISRGAGGSLSFARDVVVTMGGTATFSADYSVTGAAIQTISSSAFTVRIPAGQASVTVTVTPVVDSLAEGAESVTFTAEFTPATATIADEPLATIVASDANASETGPDSATFTISRGAGAGSSYVRDVFVSVGGTAAFSISGGPDYGLASAAITSISSSNGAFTARIPAGQTSVTVTATPADDAISEGPETIILTAEGTSATATIAASDNAAMSLALVGAQVIGVSRTATLQVTLAVPAPAGGVTVTISADVTGLVSIPPPGTVFIPAGGSTGSIVLTGQAVGTTTLRGNATGFAETTLPVTVTLNIISTPATLNVPLGQGTSLPITIGPSPAPAGGLVVDVVSANPSVIEVVTPQVTIPAGALSANATVRGAGAGTAVVTVSNPTYAPASTTVTSTANLNITVTAASFTAGFPAQPITVRLESAGVAIAAPADLAVTLSPADSTCVVVPATVTIPAGQVSATFQPAHGGGVTLPCTTAITASASGLTSDSVSVTVNPPSPITVGQPSVTVGAGLQFPSSATLGSAEHGGVAVTVTSSDPSRVLVSPNGTTAGSASITVNVLNGAVTVPFTVQGLENVTGSATVTVSAPGFINGTMTVNVVPSAVEIIGLATTATSLASDDGTWYVRVGLPNAGNTALSQAQNVRAGGPAFVVTLNNSNAAVAQLRSDEPVTAGQVVTKPIRANTSNTQAIVAGTSYGLAFDPLAGGVTTVTVTGPAGVGTTTAGSVTVTVTGAGITPVQPTVTLGSRLQVSTPATLGGAQHGGVAVTVTSSDPSRVLVSPNGTTAGTASITVNVANGSTSVPFYVQGLENVTGAATVTIAAPGFSNGTMTVNVVPSAVEILGLATATTSLASDDVSWYVRVGLPNAGNTTLSQTQNVRAGGPAFVVTLSNSNATVAQLRSDEPVTVGQAVTKPIQPNVSITQAIVAGTTFGLAFDPLAGGVTTVTVTGPAGVGTTTAGSVTVTVTGAGITPAQPTVTLGSRLQVSTPATLGGAQHGGVAVTVTSSDPSRVLVSPNGTTAGTASITVNVANGSTSVPFYVQGLENVTGAATVTIGAPGFSNGTMTVNVVPSAVEILGLATATTSLASDDVSWYVRVGLPNAGNTALSQAQNVRAGGPAFVVTLSNSNAAVAQLRSDEPATVGQAVTKPIQPNVSNTQAIGGTTNYGLAFDPLTGGTTTVTVTGPAGVGTTASGVVAIGVSAPGISLSTSYTVGAGLQVSTPATLGGAQHGGVAVTISSSAPGLLLVSPNATTAGTASITVNVANGVTNVPFYMQAVENVTGTAVVTLSAPGFTNGSTTVAVSPAAIEIIGLPASVSAGAGESTGWYVRSGVPNVSLTTLAAVQAVRTGGPGFTVTLTSSNAAVAVLRSDEPVTTGASVTKPIAPTSSNTQAILVGTSFGLSFRPLSGGTTTITATGPAGVVGVSGSSQVISVVGTPTVLSIAATDPDASEAGADSGTFTITRTGGDITQSVFFNMVRTGSATAASDYVNFTGTSGTIPANQSSLTLTVTALADLVVDPAETVTLTLTDSAAYDLGASTTATVTIADDPTIVSIAATDATASEVGLDTGSFVVTRTGGAIAQSLLVSMTRSGSATAGSDYTNFTGTSVTIPANQTSVTITVTPLADLVVDPAETVTLTLSSSPNYNLGVSSTASVTIADDPTTVTIVATDATASEAGGDTGTFTISRTGGALAQNLLVNMTRTGTATAGTDYGNFTGTSVTIPANQTSVTITVTPLADLVVDPAETVTLTLSTSPNYNLGANSTATVTIVDDPTIVSVTATDAAAAEVGGDTGTFTISRTGGALAQNLLVSMTRTGTATAGTDYANFTATSVTIPANQTSVTIAVTPINDTTVEGLETVILTLSPSGNYNLGASTTATVTIASDE